MKYLYLTIAGLCCLFSVCAQRKDIYVLPQAALLNGDVAVSAQVSLTAGMEYGLWSFGLGAAIDYYKIRTVPVFADIRRKWNARSPVFAYSGIGYDIAWPTETQYMWGPDNWGGNREDHFTGGWYGELGIGYAFENGKKQGVVLSLGYSLKTVTEITSEPRMRDFPPYTIEWYDKNYDYNFGRIVIKAGFRL